jgi:hypothetical protein
MKYTSHSKGQRLTEQERKAVKAMRDNRRKGGKRKLAVMLSASN